MTAAYIIRAVSPSGRPLEVPSCPVIMVHAFPYAGRLPGRWGLHPWMLGVLAQGYDLGLYIGEFGMFDPEERECDPCLREERLYWDGRRGSLCAVRDLDSGIEAVREARRRTDRGTAS